MKSFNKIYRVSFNANEYRLIQEAIPELPMDENNIIIFDGSSKQSDWKIVDAAWLDHESYNNLPVPDIAGYGATVFAVPETLLASFAEKSIKDSCELLPINMGGGHWYVLNVVAHCDAIDESLTIRNMRNGKPSRTRLFKRLVLDSKKIDTSGLFRVEGARLATFCTNEEGGFYDTVQKQKLTGLTFTEVEVS